MVQARCDGCGLVEASRRMEDVEPGFGQVFQRLSARHSLPDQLTNLGGGVSERLRLAEAEGRRNRLQGGQRRPSERAEIVGSERPPERQQ